MSLDLMVLPILNPADLTRADTYCFDNLRFLTDYDLFGQFVDLPKYTENVPSIPTHPLPTGLKINYFGEAGLLSKNVDGYDAPLTFVYAKDLASLAIDEYTPPYNKAIVAFLKALPPETPIVLMWR